MLLLLLLLFGVGVFRVCVFFVVVILNIPVVCASLAITSTVNRIRTKVGVISGLVPWVDCGIS